MNILKKTWLRNKERVLRLAHCFEVISLMSVIFIGGMGAGAWFASTNAERDRVALRYDHLKQLELIQAAHQKALETLVPKIQQAASAANDAAVTADNAAEKASKASVKATEAATATARISRGQQAVKEYIQRSGK